MVFVFWQVFACVAGYVLYRWVRLSRDRPPLPPGPPPYPLIGHLGVVPQNAPERAYMAWSREYGSDVIYVNVLGKSIVVLNSASAATDLLEKRGSIYSDRPAFPSFELMGYHDHLTFLSSKDSMFPAYRRLFQNDFSKAASRKFVAIQENEARKLVHRIITKQGDWQTLMRLFSTAVIMQILTGQEILGPNDEYVAIAEGVNRAVSEGPPLGTAGLDLFPWLKYLPDWCDPTGSTKHARKWTQAVDGVQSIPFLHVVKEIIKGTAKPSLVADAVYEEEARTQRGEARILSDRQIQGVIGAAYGAAQETTTDTLIAFVFGITTAPEVQKKAKVELDAVVDPDRLPKVADRESLPYIERIVQETFRFWPTIPLGVPHRALQDDVYKGMFIPKGSLVLFNGAAISHDETVYSDPWRFNPDRYLAKEQGGLGEPLPSSHFGYGRRICPGRFTAENSVFVAIATMLHVLSFTKELDEEGREIIIDPERAEYTGGLGSHPKRVPCVIAAASKRAAELVAECM